MKKNLTPEEAEAELARIDALLSNSPTVIHDTMGGGGKNDAWREFVDSGMLWWVNRIIHTFGWSIQVVEEDDGTITSAFPIRSTWLGFLNEVNEVKLPAFQEHIKSVSQWMDGK